MKIRALKIAVSAVSVLACLLLIALLVRSYRVADVVHWAASSRLTMSSASGVIGVSLTKMRATPGWGWNTIEIMPGSVSSWYFHSGRDGTSLRFPHRLSIAVLVLLTGAPWIRWHFSLRTMLIVMGVIAVLLGLIAVFAR